MAILPISSPASTRPLTSRERAALPHCYEGSSGYDQKCPLPLLRLQFDDLSHPGSDIIMASLKGAADIATQVRNVLHLLYANGGNRPGTRSVTLVVKSFDGVAYTSGISLDNDHKEICISADYVFKCDRSNVNRELLGVICHELVHCFQWDARGTCPGGLIEGLADWVRLRSGLAARHWSRNASGEWDQGYQITAYFLDYLEHRFGTGTVAQINQVLNRGPFDLKHLFQECCAGHTVEELWREYGEDIESVSSLQSKLCQAPLLIPE